MSQFADNVAQEDREEIRKDAAHGGVPFVAVNDASEKLAPRSKFLRSFPEVFVVFVRF